METKREIIKNWEKLSLILRKKDIVLQPIIDVIGPPKLKLSTNYFRSLVEYIVWQQLSPNVASIIIERIKCLSPPFPKPDFFLENNYMLLKKVGLSRSKTLFLKDLSLKWKNKKWRKNLKFLDDKDLTDRLCEVKGIGIWTAQMFMIFSLGRPNILPTSDYGIRKGVKSLYKLEKLPSPSEVPKIVPHWEGAYSIGAWYVWQAINRKILI